MQTVFDTISATIDIKINRLKNELRLLLKAATQRLSSIFSFSISSTLHNFRQNTSEQSRLKDWTFEKIQFFDSIVNDQDFVINLKKHVFYKNVYVFVNPFKIVDFKKKNLKRLFHNVYAISLLYDIRQNCST